MLGMTPGYGDVGSLQVYCLDLLQCLAGFKPKAPADDGFQGFQKHPGDNQVLSADGACSML